MRYRGWLTEAAPEYGCAIHGYVLMTNHVHLLVTPRAADSLPRTMQSLGRRYVRDINAAYRRTGTLWEGRYRAAPIDGEAYFFACCRYIELNPVRARMVAHPRDYRWSSYRAHAHGATDTLVSGHDLYRRLDRTQADREKAHRALFRAALHPDFIADLRGRPMAAGRSATAASSGRLPERSAVALSPCREAALPRRRPSDGN